MKILICHERFLSRFGADHALLLLARGLGQLGHAVVLAGNRYDRDVAGAFAGRVIDTPADLGACLDLNELTADWLRDSWSRLFPGGTGPDVVIVGGCPFIASIPFFRKVCNRVIFVDFGVVPTDGYSEQIKITLAKLHRLRSGFLKHCSLVVGISEFIANSQSRVDAGNATPVRSVLLGADHVDMSIWPGSSVREAASGNSLALLQGLRRKGKKMILCLGRWEPGCYKNSQAAFEVLEQILITDPDCCLLVLEKEGSMHIPPHLAGNVFPVGLPDDAELNEIMMQSDLGISMSLWEGFNLPLAEMQWLGRPALAFDVGAHCEVVAHPWYLCVNVDEMALKARAIFQNAGPDGGTTGPALDRFRGEFTWKRFVDEYAGILSESDRELPSVAPGTDELSVVIDVTNAAKNPANPGVIRVARRLSRELQTYVAPIFAIWDAELARYVLPTDAEYAQLGQFNGPVRGDAPSSGPAKRTPLEEFLPSIAGKNKWIFLPETLFETHFRQIRDFATTREFRVAAIFYDAIPVLKPNFCNEAIRNNHASYMRGLAECDLAIPISNFSADCLRHFWSENAVTGRCQVVPNLLPGEFAGAERNSRATVESDEEIRILCVSTLEPRKNHQGLIEACLQMEKLHPDLNWSLTLVGNRYSGAPDIEERVVQTAATNPRVCWLGIVDDATLNKCYRNSSFTVYASTIEGFGLPIMESVWHGRPCICYQDGVMAELAEGGGCLTTDVMDPVVFAESIYRLATDAALRLRLSKEAVARPIKTWAEYGKGVMGVMDALAAAPKVPWDSILYSNCLCSNWQMNDSERMALTGLLARLKPNCSIEVGTFCGGSLSLISQFSNMVFSIDIDPEIPRRFGYFENVSFLTGGSSVLLPHLLAELEKAGLAVEFVLIDGDHSADAVRGDIESLSRYVPREPMFAVLHDSFNPECRRGMLAADWGRSPYCHWVDLDFVPGRITEHGGAGHGELWGGLAAAYFHPSPRSGPLTVGRSAEGLFQALK